MIIIAALFSGIGGGVIRDLLARRRPIALQEEIHAVLTVVVGLAVWIGGESYKRPIPLLILVTIVVLMRMLAIRLKYRKGAS